MSDETAATVLSDVAADAPADAWVGSVVGERYRLLEKLGEGGMGAVFLAEHVSLRKQVALKTIHANLSGHAEIAARFAREAMVSARLEHPNIVAALDYGTLDDGGAYLVMQLVRGEGLRRRMEREPVLPWRTACELARQISDAVATAHAAGIVHRDLKPENVVLEPREGDATPHVKVLDFGIAHLRSHAVDTSAGAAGAPLTRVGAVMGTPGYMAPEQAVGQPVDERADLYAIGVMLWEMIAGQRPFEGSTLTELVTKQFATKPPPLPPDAQRVPDALAALIEQLLDATVDKRPASAIDVRDRLQAVLAAEGRGAAVSSAASIDRHEPRVAASLAKLAHRVRAAPKAYKLAMAVGMLVCLVLLVRAFQDDTPSDGPAAKAAEARERAREEARDRQEAREERRAAKERVEEPEGESPKPKEAIKAAAGRVRDGVKRIFR